MQINSLQDLYQTKLQLIYDAEEQALQAYPQLLQLVQNDQLRQALQQHMQVTQQQVQMLQQLFQAGGASAQQQRCQSMQALIQEGQQMAGQIQDPDTRDAFLIGAAQAMEHHEIAAYGTARAWAEELGLDDAVGVLETILDQEKQADDLLTQVAERRVNENAAQSDREVPLNAQSEGGSASAARQGDIGASSQGGSQSTSSSANL